MSEAGKATDDLSTFELLLKRLDSDRHCAAEKYEELRCMLIKYFECNGRFPAEDLADETLDMVARRLNDTNVENIPAFARGVAKNIDRNARRKDARTVKLADLPLGGSSLSDGRDPEADIHNRVDDERRMRCLQQCVKHLPNEERQFFISYHNIDPLATEYRQELARGLGVSYGAIRTRASRLRTQLEKCVRKCLSAF